MSKIIARKSPQQSYSNSKKDFYKQKNQDKNKALQGREVWLLPDHGQYWNWATVAHENGWQIFDQIEKNPIFPGCDILDLLEAGALGKDLLKFSKL